MENKNIPVHVSIIMDGNGRWAKARGKDRVFGHFEGVLDEKRGSGADDRPLRSLDLLFYDKKATFVVVDKCCFLVVKDVVKVHLFGVECAKSTPTGWPANGNSQIFKYRYLM